MSNKIVTPSARDLADLPPSIREWIRNVSKTVNGGVEGGDRITGIVDGTTVTNPNVLGVGNLAATITAQAENTSQAQATATAVAGGSGSTLSATASPSVVTGREYGTVTVNPTGGTSPYTFMATRIAGSTDIEINNVTVANPVFNLRNTKTGERSATWKVTVADDVGATFSVSFPVTLFGDSL